MTRLEGFGNGFTFTKMSLTPVLVVLIFRLESVKLKRLRALGMVTVL